MDKNSFLKKKQELKELVFEKLSSSVNEYEAWSLRKLLELLDQYTFENSKIQKGRISRIIVDSLNIDYQLGEEFISFDQML